MQQCIGSTTTDDGTVTKGGDSVTPADSGNAHTTVGCSVTRDDGVASHPCRWGETPPTVIGVRRCWYNRGIRHDGRQHPIRGNTRLPCEYRLVAPLALNRIVPLPCWYGVTRWLWCRLYGCCRGQPSMVVLRRGGCCCAYCYHCRQRCALDHRPSVTVVHPVVQCNGTVDIHK